MIKPGVTLARALPLANGIAPAAKPARAALRFKNALRSDILEFIVETPSTSETDKAYVALKGQVHAVFWITALCVMDHSMVCERANAKTRS
jgi:hypothetical protein